MKITPFSNRYPVEILGLNKLLSRFSSIDQGVDEVKDQEGGTLVEIVYLSPESVQGRSCARASGRGPRRQEAGVMVRYTGIGACAKDAVFQLE